jgi:hypothetical protein
MAHDVVAYAGPLMDTDVVTSRRASRRAYSPSGQPRPRLLLSGDASSYSECRACPRSHSGGARTPPVGAVSRSLLPRRNRCRATSWSTAAREAPAFGAPSGARCHGRASAGVRDPTAPAARFAHEGCTRASGSCPAGRWVVGKHGKPAKGALVLPAERSPDVGHGFQGAV